MTNELSTDTVAAAAETREATPCALQGRCGGCPWLGRPLVVQRAEKVESLVRTLTAAGVWSSASESPEAPPILHGVAADGLRDRVDLALRIDADGSPKLGLYAIDHERVVDIAACPAMSPALAAWFAEVRRDLPPVKVASIRLRVSPSGARGIWLDLANVEVKALLDEKDWLTRAATRGVVEIGQRRKRVVTKPDGRLGLGASAVEPWWQTWHGGSPLAVWTAVGSFTQPSHTANAKLVEQFEAAVEARGVALGDAWVELGAGSGNLTLPLAALGAEVTALELDEIALTGLARSAAAAGVAARVTTLRRSFVSASAELLTLLAGAKGLVVDPPRSGLGDFLDVLAEVPAAARPPSLVYVSCHGDTFATDAARLKALGYRLTALTGVDQFPQTPHAEWLGTFALA
jgi:23S rRNA (uracil1939-C5)-methyltransferase